MKKLSLRYFMPPCIPDHTESIQLCLAALAVYGGGTLEIPPGIYNISSTIELYPGTDIEPTLQ